MPKVSLFSLFLLSTSALAFEISLTRLFSITQFYHFAFMIVSLALLGYGASGTYLAIFPAIRKLNPIYSLGWASIGQAISTLVAYLFSSQAPFDSFSIAWNVKQAWLLIAQFTVLMLPFFFNGLGIGLLLTIAPSKAGIPYAVNLFGSASGCLLALFAPSLFGVAGMMTLCCGLAALAALICFILYFFHNKFTTIFRWNLPVIISFGGSFLILGFACLDLSGRISGAQSKTWMELKLSPYKSLSYALQYPGAQVISRKWNAFSQIDILRSGGIRSFPGMSYRCSSAIPAQDGLLVDGDELTPIVRSKAEPSFYECLPGAAAFTIRPGAEVLILEPRGGLDILTALNLGAKHVTAVEANPLIVQAAAETYSLPRVTTITETERSFLHRTPQSFDIIWYALTASYHPVRAGTFSLAEDYRYTLESFQEALSKLKPGGLLLITRWLQNPPSEDLKTFALALTAVEKTGGNPETQIIAFRGYNTATFLVSNQPYSPPERELIRSFTAEKAYDLIYTHNLKIEETNIYNVLPESIYFRTYTALAQTQPRQSFYRSYPFLISPPTDDQPFFGHFFKWSQIKQITAELGKTSQPFGGAGFLVMIGLLGLSILLASLVILLPLTFSQKGRERLEFSVVLYFAMLGLGFLFVEIPLIQRFILYLGQPAYAMIAVLFSLLFFSAIGSHLSKLAISFTVLIALIFLLILTPFALPGLFSMTFVFPVGVRLIISLLVLAPIGILMGMPFPKGIQWFSERRGEAIVPWAWGINGAISVIAAVLAALLAAAVGFNWVFWLGALCYSIALITVQMEQPHCSPRPSR